MDKRLGEFRPKVRELDTEKPIVQLMDKSRYEVAKKVGEEMGIGVGIYANEGETYHVESSGYTGKVPEGKVQASVFKGLNQSLSEFWNAVDEASKKTV